MPRILFDGAQFRTVADNLVPDASSASEAELRTAISRVYRACLLVAASRFIVRGMNPKKGQLHGAVRDKLPYNLKNKMFKLVQAREHADYDVTPDYLTSNADCPVCEDIRQRRRPDSPMVAERDWKKALDLADELLPLLRTV